MHRRREAFTLIELLVVVAIVGMLVAILMPSLSGARKQAKASVCLSNLKRLGMGMVLYMNGNRDQFPPFRLKKAIPRSDVEVYVNAWGRKKPRWQWFVDPEEVGPVIDPEPFRNEVESTDGFGDSSVGESGESGRKMTNKYFLCPSLADEFEFDIRNGAYGYNYQYLGNSRQDTSDDRWDNFGGWVSKFRGRIDTIQPRPELGNQYCYIRSFDDMERMSEYLVYRDAPLGSTSNVARNILEVVLDAIQDDSNFSTGNRILDDGTNREDNDE